MIDLKRCALYEWPTFIDNVEEANRFASCIRGAKPKHAKMKQPHPYEWFSIVIMPTTKDHLNPKN